MRCERCGYATHDAVIERRRSPRHPAVFPVTLVYHGERQAGMTRDVSVTGVAVQVEGELPPVGTAVRLEVDSGGGRVELPGRVAWARAAAAGGGELGIAVDPIRVPPRAMESLLSLERKSIRPN